MTFYGTHVCPYVGSLNSVVVFALFCISLALIQFVLTPRVRDYFRDTKTLANLTHLLFTHLFCWIGVGVGFSAFDYYVMGFPLGSGAKIIFGFFALGCYAGLVQLLNHTRWELENLNTDLLEKRYQDRPYNSIVSRFMSFVVAALVLAGVSIILLLRNDLQLHREEYLANPDRILLSFSFHTLFILVTLIFGVYQLARKYRYNLSLAVDKQLNQLDGVLKGAKGVSIPVLSNDEFSMFARHANLLIKDIQFKSVAIKELQTANATDPLTGVHNRNYLNNYLAQLNTQDKPTAGFILLLFDLDNFKRLNDSYGHAFGDEVLVAFAQLMRQRLSEEDVFVRFGGEEFLAMLPEVSWQHGQQIAELLCKQTHSLNLYHDSRLVPVSCSIGVSKFAPDEESLADALERADQALYRAKSAGRNRVMAA